MGVASVGWAVMAESADGSQRWLDDFGVRLFNPPQDPRSEETFAQKRREHRSSRRVRRRKLQRIKRIKGIFYELKLISKESLEAFLTSLRVSARDWPSHKKNINSSYKKISVTNKILLSEEERSRYVNFYYLAKEAESRKISAQNLVYILIYLCRHRGYNNSFESDFDRRKKEVNSKKDHADQQKRLKNSSVIKNFQQLYQHLLLRGLKSFRSNDNPYYENDINFIVDEKYLPLNKIIKENWFHLIQILNERFWGFWKDYQKILKKKKQIRFVEFNNLINNYELKEVLKTSEPSSQNKKLHCWLEIKTRKNEFLDLKFISEKSLKLLFNFYKAESLDITNLKRENFQSDDANFTSKGIIRINDKKDNKIDYSINLIEKIQKKSNSTFLVDCSLAKQKVLKGFLYKGYDEKLDIWRNEKKYLFRREFIRESLRKILKKQSEFYQINDEKINEMVEIVCHQRSFENGPGKSSSKNDNRYFGFNSSSLALISKKSRYSNRIVGFRNSLVGDIFNFCCEVSKITAKFKPRDNKKLNEFNTYALKKLFAEPDLSPGAWKKVFIKKLECSGSAKAEVLKAKNIGINPTFLRLVNQLRQNGYQYSPFNENGNLILKKDDIFALSNIFHKNKTPSRVLARLGIWKIDKWDYFHKKEVISDSLKKSIKKIIADKNPLEWVLDLYRKLKKKNISMCNFTFDEMIKIIRSFEKGVDTNKLIYEIKNSSKIFASLKTQQQKVAFRQDLKQLFERSNCTSEERKKFMFKWSLSNVITEYDLEDFKNNKFKDFLFNFYLPTKENLITETNRKSINKNRKELTILPKITGLANGVVCRGLTQARKVLNSLIKKYKTFETINLELAKELSQSKTTRNKISKENEKNKIKNQEFISKGMNPLKGKLKEEADGKCFYCNDETIYNQGEIDHIIPRSLTCDNSHSNKIWSCKNCNSSKLNQTAYDFMKSKSSEKRRSFDSKIKILSNKKGNDKKCRLLKMKSSDYEEIRNLNSRVLNDYSWISVYFRDYLKASLPNTQINSINGRITSKFRSLWLFKSGINNPWGHPDKKHIRDITPFHHAVDAMVLAGFINQKELFLQKMMLSYWQEELPEKEKQEFLTNMMVRNSRNIYYHGFFPADFIYRIKNKLNEQRLHPFFRSNKFSFSEELKKRIPLQLVLTCKEKEIMLKGVKRKVSEIVPDKTKFKIIKEDEYYKTNSRGCIYPYISRMVICKVKRGGFGSENPVPSWRAKNESEPVDKNNWKFNSYWGYYASPNNNANMVDDWFIKTQKVFHNFKNIKKNNWSWFNCHFDKRFLTMPEELLECRSNGDLNTFYISGRSGGKLKTSCRSIYLSKNFSFCITEKNFKWGSYVVPLDKIVRWNLKKVKINILGHKNSS